MLHMAKLTLTFIHNILYFSYFNYLILQLNLCQNYGIIDACLELYDKSVLYMAHCRITHEPLTPAC